MVTYSADKATVAWFEPCECCGKTVEAIPDKDRGEVSQGDHRPDVSLSQALILQVYLFPIFWPSQAKDDSGKHLYSDYR